MLETIEAVLDEYVRPLLRTHGGDMKVLGYEDGVVRFKLTGVCAGCSAADLTSEDLINKELTEHIPEVKKAVLETEVSEDLLRQAREMLARHHEQ